MTSPVPTYGTAPDPERDAAVDRLADEVDGLVSDLNDLRAELAASDSDLSEPYVVPTRPRYSIRYRLDFDAKQLDKWRRASKDRTFSDGIDGGKFGALVCGATAAVILRDGRPDWLPGTDRPTFQSAELRELLQTSTVADTVHKFYGRPGAVDAAGRRILSDAGYGDEVTTAEDPS